MKPCPHCGASLHEEASFCPYCTQSVNPRKQVHSPRHMRLSGRAVRTALIVFAAAAALLILGLWLHSRPRVYDNGGTEVIYRDRGVDYQLCIAWANTPFTPAAQDRYTTFPMDDTCRYPVLLYINLAGSEVFAAEEFLERVDGLTAEIVNLDSALQMTCAQPERRTDYVPDSAAVVYVDFITTQLGRHSGELILSVRMRNGDVIRLHQNQVVDTSVTYDYTPEDAPMDTAEDLAALLKQIESTVQPDAEVNIHLPPVTYTEQLDLEGRPFNLIGSTDEAGNRTTFAAPVRVVMQTGTVLFWEGVDFTGPGQGTGLSVSARMHLTDCRIGGWETGVLAHKDAWVNIDECLLRDNAVAFHFNASSGSVSDSRYNDNIFRNNGTAVLLESVPTDLALSFLGTRFEQNGTDIDNRCGQALDLDGAFFH